MYDVVTVISSSEVDIVNAQILNTSDGYALQTFRLAPVNTNNVEMPQIADHIVHRLQERLSSSTSATMASLLTGTRNKFFSSPTKVKFNNMTEKNSTRLTIETMNRIGVLENIAKTFVDCKVKVLDARITSAGEKALDYFIIRTRDDNALSKEQKSHLKQQLKESL